MMENKIKVSVVIPVFNVEKYLSACVNSVLNQTLKDIEIILVDDESPDNCPLMCDEYAKRDSRVKVIHKKNGGLGFARNSGLEIATGEYVTFLDSDDYVDLTAYQQLYDIAKQNDLDMLRFGLDRFKDEGCLKGHNDDDSLQIIDSGKKIKQLSLRIFSKPLFEEQENLFSGGSVCVVLFKNEFLRENHLVFGSEKKMLSEDFVFIHQCYLHIKRIGNIPHTYYHYRINPNSITTKVDVDKMDKVYEFCDYFTNLYKKDGFADEVSTVYPMGYYLSAMRAQAKLILLSCMPIKQKREWFNRVRNHPYTKQIAKRYPMNKLTVLQRIHFRVLFYNLFFTMLLLVGISKLLKRQ